MSEEKIIIGKDTKYPLKGILTIPEKAEAPYPSVVFVHGSGSSDMNEHIGGLYIFRDLAAGLAKRGIASVRYDKRTFAHGFRMIREKKPITVFEETIEDAILAAQLLRNDPRMDPEKVFVIGHSMGGMLAPRIDAEGGNFKGLILMAGSPYKMEEILCRQMDEMRQGAKGLTAKIMAKQAEKIIAQFEGLYEKDIEETKKIRLGGGTTLYYFREMGEHPAENYLLNSDKPVLILQGDKDFQVRADTDYARYQEMLKDRKNVTYHLYPGLNHLFVTAKSTDISDAKNEYKTPRNIPVDVMNDISSWIFENC